MSTVKHVGVFTCSKHTSRKSCHVSPTPCTTRKAAKCFSHWLCYSRVAFRTSCSGTNPASRASCTGRVERSWFPSSVLNLSHQSIRFRQNVTSKSSISGLNGLPFLTYFFSITTSWFVAIKSPIPLPRVYISYRHPVCSESLFNVGIVPLLCFSTKCL